MVPKEVELVQERKRLKPGGSQRTERLCRVLRTCQTALLERMDPSQGRPTVGRT